MRCILFLTCTCLIGLNSTLAQQGGAQTLRLAQSIYEQGRLHELPSLLKDSEIAKYSKSEKVNAYRLLTLANIYLEEPQKADESMLKLLKTEHFYEPNEQVEPAEFIGLYKTFRTKPVFNMGFKLGVNSTLPMLMEQYYVSVGSEGQGKYSTSLGFQPGLVFEKAIFSNSKNKILNHLILAPEVFYTSRGFKYDNASFAAGAAQFKATIKQTWVDFNLMVQLKLNKSKTLLTYATLGPGVSYMLKGTISTPSNTWANGAGAVSGPDVENTNSYKKIVPSVIGGAGVKIKLGEIYVLAEGRIQYGLISPVNPSTRTDQKNPQSVFDYNYILPDYKPLTLMANIGLIYPYFKPIKLKRK
jgi:hypothetical protein